MLDRLSRPARAGAAVKANAYGLGVDACVPVLRDAGCEHFFVAHWSEVAAVARHVPAASIAVLHGAIDAAEIDYAKAVGAVPVINSLDQARAWCEAGGGRCHLMVDTGINRLGIAPEECAAPEVQALDVDMLMSHLASADEDSAMNAAQLASFRKAASRVKHRCTSLSNSAGVALGSDFAFDIARPGLALYGGIPRPELEGVIKQVARIHARILQVRHIKAGDQVGYNGEFTAPSSMRVGTVSMGYADGFLRSRGPGTALLFGDKACPIRGKVSMDMIVVDLANAAAAQAGDWLEVPFFLPDAARQSAVSQYELLTLIGPRLRT